MPITGVKYKTDFLLKLQELETLSRIPPHQASFLKKHTCRRGSAAFPSYVACRSRRGPSLVRGADADGCSFMVCSGDLESSVSHVTCTRNRHAHTQRARCLLSPRPRIS